MAYNKAKAQKDWELWKKAEEDKMRNLGVDEITIQKLREYDWNDFNSERRFYEKLQEADNMIDFIAAEEPEPYIRTVESLLDNIENQHLYQVLVTVDKLTLQIVLWRMDGYNSQQISQKCGLTVEAVNFRMWHLRKKIKKLLRASNILRVLIGYRVKDYEKSFALSAFYKTADRVLLFDNFIVQRIFYFLSAVGETGKLHERTLG